MTQISIIQITSQPTQTIDSPSNSNQNSFNPLLENAAAEAAETIPDISSEEFAQTIPPSDVQPPEIQGPNIFMLPAPAETATTQSKSSGENLTQLSENLKSVKYFKREGIESVFAEAKTNPEAKINPSLLQSAVNNTNSSFKIDITMTDPQGNTIQPSPLTNNEAILQQLQQIIHNGNETSTVSIQGTISRHLLHFDGKEAAKLSNPVSTQPLDSEKIFEKPTLEATDLRQSIPTQQFRTIIKTEEQGKTLSDIKSSEIEVKLSGLVSTQSWGSEGTSEKPALQTPVVRQDIQAQYLEGKINNKEQGNTDSNTKNSDQQSGANNQQFATTLESNSSLSPEQSNSFQQLSTLMQDIQSNHTQNMSKPIILPSGTFVFEEDIMQQVIERLQIIGKPNDTRLSLKLHPVDLGELKIDLMLKEGSIKANIIVQNIHIQEIVERNISKLRNILEKQGFTVDEIAVTSGSELVPDFDFFDQHLPYQNDFSPTVFEAEGKDGFNLVLEDAPEESVGSPTGINIKV